MRLAALAFAALVASSAGVAAGPMARATWSFPNGPGIMLGAAPGGVGLDVAVTDWSPYVAVQGEWEAGRVDAGLAGNVDLFLPLAGWGVSGSVMKSWSSESTYAGARAWVRKGVLSLSAGLYERFHGDSGDYRVVTAGVGVGYR